MNVLVPPIIFGPTRGKHSTLYRHRPEETDFSSPSSRILREKERGKVDLEGPVVQGPDCGILGEKRPSLDRLAHSRHSMLVSD